MENERKESKTRPISLSLTPAVEAAGKLMASRRLRNHLTGTFSAYIRDLIERDVAEEIRRDPELSARIQHPARDPIAAFLEADAANSAAARDQKVADKIRADVHSEPPPTANEAVARKRRIARKRDQFHRDSDHRSSPTKKDL